MRVALNLVYLVERSGGVGRYMAELTGGLVRAGVDVVALHSPSLPARVRSAPWARDVDWIDVGVDVEHGPPWAFATTTWEQWVTNPRRARRAGVDVLHGPAYVGPPRAKGLRTVVTVPDLIYTRYPALLDWRTRTGMGLTVGPSARGADRVIAISEAVRDDVITTLRVAPERVDVTPLGADVDADSPATPASELRARLDVDDRPIVLCVAQKRVHKNLDGLVRAVAHLRDRDAVVVLVGLPTPHEHQLRARAAELGVQERIRHLGWVGEADLEGLYRAATVCCLPSFEEGFGLPVIEAMVRGVAVACSRGGALEEVAGAAAELFDPHDPVAIAAALDRLLLEPERRETLVAAGRRRAAEFTWDRCAAATIAVYERALTAPGRRERPRSTERPRP